MARGDPILRGTNVPRSIRLTNTSSRLLTDLKTVNFGIARERAENVGTGTRSVDISVASFITSLPSNICALSFSVGSTEDECINFRLVLRIVTSVSIRTFTTCSN